MWWTANIKQVHKYCIYCSVTNSNVGFGIWATQTSFIDQRIISPCVCIIICRTTWFSVKLYTSDCRALNLFSSQSLFSKSQVCLNSIIKIYSKCLYLHIFIDKKKMKMRIDGLSKSRYNCLPSICQIRVVPLPLVRLELSPFHVSDFAHPP